MEKRLERLESVHRVDDPYPWMDPETREWKLRVRAEYEAFKERWEAGDVEGAWRAAPILARYRVLTEGRTQE